MFLILDTNTDYRLKEKHNIKLLIAGHLNTFDCCWNCKDHSYCSKAHDTCMRNSCELTRARNLYVCHTDLQQDISRINWSMFYFVQVSRASFSCICHGLNDIYPNSEYRKCSYNKFH